MEHRLLVEIDDHRHELEVLEVGMLINPEPATNH